MTPATCPSRSRSRQRSVIDRGANIYLVDITTIECTKILESPTVDIRSPFVSRDGKLLYYATANDESDIWLLDLAEKK